MIRRIVILLGIVVGLSTPVKAQQMHMVQFKKATEQEARVNPVLDRNRQSCALVKLSTTLKDLTFDSSLGITKVIPKKGEYWLYLSPDERRIEIGHPDFERFRYTISEKIEEKTTYYATLRADALVKKKLVEKAPGILYITSTPTGAMVYINGESTGQVTPFQQAMKVGEYKVEVKKELYLTFAKQVKINYELTTKLKPTLTPNFGSVELKGKAVPGLNVKVDGLTKKLDESMIDEVSVGKHLIEVSAPKYGTFSDSLTVYRGHIATFEYKLDSKFATVTFDIHKDAKLSIDKLAKTGRTFSLSEGIHLIEIKRPYYEPYKQTIELKGGQNKTIRTTLVAQMGTLQISTNPPTEAEVYLDGKLVGNAPLAYKTKAGEHKIKVMNQAGKPVTKTEIVLADKVTKVEFDVKGVIESSPSNIASPTTGLAADKSDYYYELALGNYNSRVGERNKTRFWLYGLGAAGIVTGAVMNNKMKSTYRDYKTDIRISYSDVEFYKNARNWSYGIGIGLLSWAILTEIKWQNEKPKRSDYVIRRTRPKESFIKNVNWGLSANQQTYLTISF